MRGNDIYKGNREEVVLSLLSDLYLELDIISVSASELSSCPISHCLLITYSINYYLKRRVNNFGLRRLFYSKQDLKNACYSSI